ncbi:MAG: 50S ribosomal protein L20 [Deltaproteobacteria bacterium]|nr:50S ribosomal protein L20 [Deltaproteobacteria bacterium]
MPRAKRGFKARRRRNRIMKHAKGNYSARGRTFRAAIAQVHHAWLDAYRHRRTHKREIRRLWIVRINAAARMHGLSYGRFIHALKQAEVLLDRKILAEIAIADPGGFKAVIDAVRS